MIKLTDPLLPEEAINLAVGVMKSGNLVQGQYAASFEHSLSTYLKVNHAVVVSSGTAALHLSLMALGIHQGDEVIVPAFTFPATVNVVELVGARPIFVDITLDDFCVDASRIEDRINERTRAIIPVHEFGQAADLDAVMSIGAKYKLLIIEDAACALGAEYCSHKVGTFGSVGCFSFHPRKAITTGEGGVLVTNDEALAAKVASLRSHGMILDGIRADFLYAGLNYRMTDFQAALGLSQIPSLKDRIQRRIEIADIYDKILSTADWIKTPSRFENRKMIFQTYHVLLADTVDRDKVISSLGEVGIETNVGAHALSCLTYYREKYDCRDVDYPTALKAYRQGLALPIGGHLTDGDVEMIARRLISCSGQ